jgi:N,N'-diacetyllegionaminate synthase
MVQAAANAGADYAKIQGLYSADLTHRPRFDAPLTDRAGEPLVVHRPYLAEVERLRRLDLSPTNEAMFVAACHEAGVRPMVTVFTRAAVPKLAGLGFAAAKIASYDCASYPLLREVAAVWSEVYVSTGAMYRAEIARAAVLLGGSRLTLLHCVTLYPTPVQRLNLARLAWLATLTPRVGFSDHTLVARDGLWASKAALALGADVIERHFTVLASDRSKDGPVSISPDELADLRRFADQPVPGRVAELDRSRPEWRDWIGEPDGEPGREELLNRDYYAGRVASWIRGRPVYNWEDVSLDVYAALSDLTAAVMPSG